MINHNYCKVFLFALSTSCQCSGLILGRFFIFGELDVVFPDLTGLVSLSLSALTVLGRR